MANGEIRTRFRLEGESEYRRGMKEAADAIKVLDSEQKLAAAQFEATGDAQQYAAETTRILRDKIVEQERAVKSAEAAMNALKEKGVDKNDKAVQEWSKKLNTAKTRLTYLQTELGKSDNKLQGTAEEFGKTETAANTFNEQLEKVGQGIDFQNTITAIDKVKDHIGGIIKAAAKALKGLWDLETDAGKWADDLLTAASKAGIDVETYQSWQYASMTIDTEVSTIISAITRLEKDLGSTNEEMAKSFNQLAIRTRNSTGSVRDAEEVFWEIVDALARVQDETTRSIYAQKLLGQSWKDLNPLIEAGSAAYKKEAEEGRKSAVVSKENVEALGKWNDSQNKLNASLTKAKYDTLAALAPTFTQVADAMSTAVGAFNDFLASAEGQEALEKLNEALSGVVTSFLGEDNGKGTFQSIVEGAAEAVKKVTGALDWFSNNGDTVKAIVLGLVGAWGALTIGEDILLLLQLLKDIPLAKLTAAFGSKASDLAGSEAGGAASAGAASAAGSAAAEIAGKTTTTAGTPLSSVLNGLSIGALFKAGIEYAKETGSGLVGYLDDKSNPKYQKIEIAGYMDEDGNIVSADKAGKQVGDEFAEAAAKAIKGNKDVPNAVDELLQAAGDAGKQTADTGIAGELRATVDAINRNRGAGQDYEEYAEKLYSALDEIRSHKDVWNKLSENTQETILGYYTNIEGTGAQLQAALAIVRDILADLDAAEKDAEEAGKGIADGMAEGLTQNQADVEAAAKDAVEAAGQAMEDAVNGAGKSRFDAPSSELNKLFNLMGENASLGLAGGISSRIAEAENAAAALADASAEAAKVALDENSPSRVFEVLGENAAVGMANGLLQRLSDVQSAARALSDIAIAEVEAGMAVVNSLLSSMSSIAFSAPSYASGGVSASSGGASGGASTASAGSAVQSVNATIVMDKKTVGYLVAPAVNEAIGATIQAQRG